MTREKIDADILYQDHFDGSQQTLINGSGKLLVTGLSLLAGLGAGMGAALASYAFLREPYDIQYEKMTIRLPRAQGRIPQAGLRLLHISDCHFQGSAREQEKIERVCRITADLEYDLLIHTGDFLHHDGGLANVLTLFDRLPVPRLGAYAVAGNHDYAIYNMSRALHYTWRNFLAREARYEQIRPPSLQTSRMERLWQYARFTKHLIHNRIDGERTGSNDVARLRYELERRGVRWLHNSSIHLCGGHAEPLDLYLAGIDDIHEGQPDLANALESVPANAPLILLSHNPDILETAAVARADLLLAGHTHGGQIVLPWVGAAHTQSEQLSRREASGYFRRGDTHIYITRGLGEGIPLRFGAPPQVTLLTLLGE